MLRGEMEFTFCISLSCLCGKTINRFKLVEVMHLFNATIESKRIVEQAFHRAGHSIRHYRADEGSNFTSGKFQLAVAEDGQTISFCAPGAHHQNGVTERAIQTVISKARTMLVHAATHWPEEFD